MSGLPLAKFYVRSLLDYFFQSLVCEVFRKEQNVHHRFGICNCDSSLPFSHQFCRIECNERPEHLSTTGVMCKFSIIKLLTFGLNWDSCGNPFSCLYFLSESYPPVQLYTTHLSGIVSFFFVLIGYILWYVR